jgi:hypothetical protein
VLHIRSNLFKRSPNGPSPVAGGGLGWGIVRVGGGVDHVGIAPIPAFPRRRGKEQFSEYLNLPHQLSNATLSCQCLYFLPPSTSRARIAFFKQKVITHFSNGIDAIAITFRRSFEVIEAALIAFIQ